MESFTNSKCLNKALWKLDGAMMVPSNSHVFWFLKAQKAHCQARFPQPWKFQHLFCAPLRELDNVHPGAVFKRQGSTTEDWRTWSNHQFVAPGWLKEFWWLAQPSQKFCRKCLIFAYPSSFTPDQLRNGSSFLDPFQPPQASHAYTGVIPRAFFRFKVEVEDLTTNVATSTADPRGSGMWWASKQRTSLPIVRELLESYIFFSILSLLSHRSRLYWNAWHEMLMWFC